ncbi:anti-FecI sigma factor, FecR [Rhizobium sp. CF080]|uniref:FecR family protein n=1 Tax=Rhizobium sp. (strain CF080) TaxID=1144310 RepID=UPI000271705F|nr:FecR domain-containing protein [Rhizobium sp. CF080]EUB98242.1 anti-FecI sigma factor, FecR [Rhizobium sp. CF080]
MNEPEQHPPVDRRIALDARDWIVRLTSGTISDAELERFKAWQDCSPDHRRAFEQERIFWQQLQVLDGRSDGLRPFPVPITKERAPLRRRGFLVGGGAIAAAAAGLFVYPRVELMVKADFSTAVGEIADFTLPDGSVASLNTDSAIAVNYLPNLRLVELLKGEAEFKVQADATSLFRVAALGGNSDALGTTFSVSAIDGLVTVTVADGNVRVRGPSTPTDMPRSDVDGVRLHVAEQTTYVSGEPPIGPTPVDIDVSLAWRKGRIIFEGRPFASAMAELGRYVPERIVLRPGIRGNVPVSAIFSTREAASAVQALAKTQGLTVRRVPGVMILVS